MGRLAVKGVIKTYLPLKKYGFIKGDDEKDYFFHLSDFKNDSAIHICDGVYVDFEEAAGPKGYRARNCHVVDPAEINTYVVPGKMMTSRTDEIRGWKTMEHVNWIVWGTSRDSPDEARKLVIDHALWAGGNAVLDLTYSKTTGEEPGEGRGVHRYSIHHFSGRIAMVARRNSNGEHTEKELTGLNARAAALKHALKEKTMKSRTKRQGVWMTVVLCVVLASMPMVGDFFGLVALAAGLYALYLGLPEDYDSWLERG